METKSKYLTGSFRDRESAERAYNRLRERGYTNDEINIIMSDDTRSKYFGKDRPGEVETEYGNKVMEGLGTGSAIGGAVGAAAGIIAAIGTSLVIPGLGLIIAGPIAAGLAGAGAGGITGGIVGALVGAGIPKEHAERYEKGIKEGDIVMGVKPKNDEDASFLEDEWRDSQAHNFQR